jgi:hypothetical protein
MSGQSHSAEWLFCFSPLVANGVSGVFGSSGGARVIRYAEMAPILMVCLGADPVTGRLPETPPGSCDCQYEAQRLLLGLDDAVSALDARVLLTGQPAPSRQLCVSRR